MELKHWITVIAIVGVSLSGFVIYEEFLNKEYVNLQQIQNQPQNPQHIIQPLPSQVTQCPNGYSYGYSSGEGSAIYGNGGTIQTSSSYSICEPNAKPSCPAGDAYVLQPPTVISSTGPNLATWGCGLSTGPSPPNNIILPQQAITVNNLVSELQFSPNVRIFGSDGKPISSYNGSNTGILYRLVQNNLVQQSSISQFPISQYQSPELYMMINVGGRSIFPINSVQNYYFSGNGYVGIFLDGILNNTKPIQFGGRFTFLPITPSVSFFNQNTCNPNNTICPAVAGYSSTSMGIPFNQVITPSTVYGRHVLQIYLMNATILIQNATAYLSNTQCPTWGCDPTNYNTLATFTTVGKTLLYELDLDYESTGTKMTFQGIPSIAIDENIEPRILNSK